MSFESRYKQLNAAQKQAVDTIDGPVMVVAGPGTGKTELLSMRVANILKQTDTLPENILCLTFTDSGAAAMRRRLIDIIGPEAYKVAIHTFHSFGSEVINQNSEYFYRGASFRPADELTSYEILRGIFDEMSYDNPLASTLNGEFTHLSDAMQTISDLKRSSLTDEELRAVLDANDLAIEKIERELSAVFTGRISASTLSLLIPAVQAIAEIEEPRLPADIVPFSNSVSISLAHAVDAATETNSTKPVTAWRNEWMQKDETGAFIMKARARQVKLRAMSYVYYQYLVRMQEAKLYDFDDMILQVVHALEVFPDLRFNLQERYQYIMVDEYQDTNLAQARVLHDLTDNEANNGRPNILVVGDDDQAIYSFQGADISNILGFRDHYPLCQMITLSENYRSTDVILRSSRGVITQGENRLESHHEEITKQLHAQSNGTKKDVAIVEADSLHDERQWVVNDIKKRIAAGEDPASIAVLARRHHELMSLLPYFVQQDIAINYEHQEDVLESKPVKLLEMLAQLIVDIYRGRLGAADASLPQLLAHPAFSFDPKDVWKLSLTAHAERRTWLDVMQVTPSFKPLADWLITLSSHVAYTPLEQLLDELLGKQPLDDVEFTAPFYDYFFGAKAQIGGSTFLAHLEALRTIRSKLRDYHPDDTPTLESFIEFIQLHRRMGTGIQAINSASDQPQAAVHLMTAHKSKGLEFDRVYIVGAVESAWGESVRSRSRSISYPENLPLMIAGSSPDERLRLFFVAMTRARKHLTISYSTLTDGGKSLTRAGFLLETDIETIAASQASTDDHTSDQLELAWYAPLITTTDGALEQLLAPRLERYAMSATDLCAFLDVTRGGPQSFLLNNLLKFPSAMSPHAAYGSAVHATLQQAHNHLRATKDLRPVEDVLNDFESNLARWHLAELDHDKFLHKGSQSLESFLAAKYESFSPDQQAELNFAHESSVLGEVRMKGMLDLVDVDETNKTIFVTDYKTGKPSRSWNGKTDAEKSKLHKYKQQLMFYKLLVEQSRTYHTYTVTSGALQFVEPTSNGDIVSLDLSFDADELAAFKLLVAAVWRRIVTLDLPDASIYDHSYKGILAFEHALIENS